MMSSYERTVSEGDITAFANISGDTNPVHMDEDFAAGTLFKGRIAHGMLSAAYISTVFGTQLPGPGCIYMSQSLQFKAPVRIGDTVVATVTVSDINAEKRRVTFDCVCTVDAKDVLTGEAMLMVDSRER